MANVKSPPMFYARQINLGAIHKGRPQNLATFRPP